MARLRHQIRETLQVYNGLDMMDSMNITVFEDQSLLDGASTSVVRDHFKQWAATAPQQEQGAGPALSQRYRYCVQVDTVALETVIHDAPAPEATSNGFVNLIWKDWEPFTPDSGEEGEEPIEGCTLDDVGWMKVAYQDAMVDMYYYLRDRSDWYREYRRPPEVAHA